MKKTMKTILTLICAVCGTTLSAQIAQGQWLAGGSLVGKYQTAEANNYNSKELQVPINIGCFVTNNLALGIRGQAQYAKTSYEMRYTYYSYYGYSSMARKYSFETQQYSGGPFVRVYLLPNKQKFNLYLEGHYAFGWAKGVSTIGSTNGAEQKYQSYNVNLAPVIFVNPNTALEFILAYNHSIFTDAAAESDAFLMGIGFQVFLGKGRAAKNKETIRK